MKLREQLKKALTRAAELKKLGGERDFTDDELTEVGELSKSIESLREKITKSDEASAALNDIADSGSADDEDTEITDADLDVDPAPKSGGARTRPRAEKALEQTFGAAFVKSDRYKAFQKAFPSGLGNGSPVDIGRVKVGTMEEYFAGRKATITTDVGRIQPIRLPTLDLIERNRLSLLDLVSRGQTGGNFEYVQVTGVTRNAAIVAEGALKPVSDMTTALADAKVYTYADGYDVTNQLLSDAPAFASFMNQELGYSLENVLEDKLLNGTGASGEPKGILATTGVQEQTYVAGSDAFNQAGAMAFVKAVRKAITKVVRLQGGKVDAVLLSPEMDEAIDLLQDADGRFYGQGPFSSGPFTLWGRPRVTSERLIDQQALVGDFKQVALLDREGLSVNAFNQHKDYAQRNMVYVRAELRAAQVIWRPNRLALVKPAA